MLQRINFHHLYYFWVIANEGSIHRACEKLKLAQPTLSIQLKMLEDQLGHPLFERKNRSLILTQVGKITLDYANQMFLLGREYLSTLQHLPHVLPRKITIGILPSLSKVTVYDLLKNVMKTQKTFVSLKEGKMDFLLRELEYHTIDLILSDKPSPSSGKKFICRKLNDIHITLVGHPKFQTLRRKFPKSLNQAPMILLTTGSQVRIDMDHYLESHNIRPQILGEIEDVALLRRFALNGIAVVPVPKAAVVEDLKSKSLCSIGELKSVRSALWAITSPKQKANELINQLIKRN